MIRHLTAYLIPPVEEDVAGPVYRSRIDRLHAKQFQPSASRTHAHMLPHALKHHSTVIPMLQAFIARVHVWCFTCVKTMYWTP